MSARRARQQRAAANARIQRTLDQAAAATPQFAESLGPIFEAWQVGPMLLVIPALRDDYPPEVKAAFDRRRRATLTGRCDCGGTRAARRGRVVHEHELDCPARDEAFGEICRRHAGLWKGSL
ncbi:hypothetical protein DPM19_18185 [Actinomadura craniellae]|uniref:Uncharacterized protein n=1 Tax=Actinomadura craniellae TaxID=2231787 RepID=A0A365H3K7_9ACTN|nr:hypothetical protein [Actinomadura craniellae]RAY13608.1 hypothetical protein DPM19_18185 [Actinomadura craniellae]